MADFSIMNHGSTVTLTPTSSTVYVSVVVPLWGNAGDSFGGRV